MVSNEIGACNQHPSTTNDSADFISVILDNFRAAGVATVSVPLAAAAMSFDDRYVAARRAARNSTTEQRVKCLVDGKPAPCYLIVRLAKLDPGAVSGERVPIYHRPSVLHANAEAAVNEAMRLAETNPGAEFVVFEAQFSARTPITKPLVMPL